MESFQLKNRRGQYETDFSTPQRSENVFLYHDITSADTLPGIALKYRVSVEIIKKANQVFNESALMAQTSIRIPVQKYGVFSEEAEESNRRRDDQLSSPTAVWLGGVGDEESQDSAPPDLQAHVLLSKVEQKISSAKEQVLRTESKILNSVLITRDSSQARIGQVMRNLKYRNALSGGRWDLSFGGATSHFATTLNNVVPHLEQTSKFYDPNTTHQSHGVADIL
eukprot:CFRG2133T1